MVAPEVLDGSGCLSPGGGVVGLDSVPDPDLGDREFAAVGHDDLGVCGEGLGGAAVEVFVDLCVDAAFGVAGECVSCESFFADTQQRGGSVAAGDDEPIDGGLRCEGFRPVGEGVKATLGDVEHGETDGGGTGEDGCLVFVDPLSSAKAAQQQSSGGGFFHCCPGRVALSDRGTCPCAAGE